MKAVSKTIPLGAIPYEDINVATKMIAKLFEQIPYLPLLPKIDSADTLNKRTLSNIPGISFDGANVLFNTTAKDYKQGLVKIDKAFNSMDIKHLEQYAIESPFIDKYFALIKKFKPKNACINLLGPFTVSQILKSATDEQLLLEKSYRKLFIQAICVKALWAIKKIEEISPETVPIIILEEPLAGIFGNIKRENENIDAELIIHIYERVFETIRKTKSLIAIQCLEKCDWSIPINAGVDIISFDAYNNPNNLCIIPEVITEFLERGGKINWGIVPVMTEAMVKSLNLDYLAGRLKSTMAGLILAGVADKLVFNSALVSVQGDVDKLPLIFAEKALILSTQLAGRIPRIH